MIDYLFITKADDTKRHQQMTSLLVSSNNIVEYLQLIGINCKHISVPNEQHLESVINDIKPKNIIFESIFVSPSILKIISNNKDIDKIIVRIHSDFPYFAIEQNGISNIFEYLKISNKIYIAPNCINFYNMPSIRTQFTARGFDAQEYRRYVHQHQDRIYTHQITLCGILCRRA
jgi:hypothetical protein